MQNLQNEFLYDICVNHVVFVAIQAGAMDIVSDRTLIPNNLTKYLSKLFLSLQITLYYKNYCQL